MTDIRASAFQLESELFGPERLVIGRCLVDPALIPEAASELAPTDFESEFLGKCFAILVARHDDGQKPSLEHLVDVFGDGEVGPGLSVRIFLNELVRSAFIGQLIPLADAIGVLKLNRARRTIARIGNDLVAASTSSASIRDITVAAALHLDDVAASMRQGARKQYDGAGIASITLERRDFASITSGLTDLDEYTGGYPRGELTVVAARPGMGKSAFATSSVLDITKSNFGCLFFSLEMTAEQMDARFLANLAFRADKPILYKDIVQQKMNPEQRQRLLEASEALKSRPIVIEVQRGLSVTDIGVRAQKTCEQFKRRGHRLDLIVVDHIGLIRPSARYAGNRVREVAEFSDGLATIAKDLDVAMVALCQLNREVEKRDIKRPTLSDLRDSGAIEEDASNVVFIYRPAYYLEQTRSDGEAEAQRQQNLERVTNDIEFIIAKNRNGSTGIVDAFYHAGANVIRDRARS